MDDGDFSSLHEENHNRMSVAQQLTKNREQPEYNDMGEKVCIDCGNDIPPKRAALTFVVRCLPCQEVEEKSGKNIRPN